MKRIDTVSELKQAWDAVADRLRRDLSAAHRLSRDPVGTLRDLGYVMSPEAERALLKALP